ncbi:MAG: TIM-barrel domain-containing protein [Bacteroidota bacterium]
MTKQLFAWLLLAMLIIPACQEKSWEKTGNGVLVHLTGQSTDSASVLRLIVETDRIIRVSAFPGNSLPSDSSLVSVLSPSKVKWEVKSTDNGLVLSTEKMSVSVDLPSGRLEFKDADGKSLLAEPETGGRRFTRSSDPAFLGIQQVFETGADEGLYGLGQHQNGEMNLKGKDIDLFQHNIVAVNPFLVSSKNYGILWDNYSITRFGDERDYLPLSEFRLFKPDGKEGALQAAYYNDLKDSKPAFIKDENALNIKFLDDLKSLPPAFRMGQGKVVWEGYFEPSHSGEHRFRVYSSGYLKMWINDELVHENWRQGWNPWTAKHSLDLKEGERYPIRIEWIPGSGQAFADITWNATLPEPERDRIRFSSEAGRMLDYYFVCGNSMDEVISGYRTITGKATMLPRWAMGLWQSRERYKTQDELLGVVKEFRNRRIPLDNIVLDWFYWPEDKWGDHDFDPKRFPDPAAMLSELHNDLHAQLMISVWPKFYEGTVNFEKLNEHGWIYPETVKNRQDDWVGYVSSFYDAFSPGARLLYWQGIKEKLLPLGIDGWWMDATEPDILSNSSLEQRKKQMSPVHGGTPSSLFNAYSLVHTGGVYAGLREDDPERRVFILIRSAFSGQQRYAAATWSGDVASRWDDLQAQIPAGLNFSMAGIPFWTTDIGGFAVEPRYEHPNSTDLAEWRELMTRWFQFGAFSPLFRVHGQFPYREMFNVAPEDHPAYQSMLFYDVLRYRMLPYIYSLSGLTWLEDYTPMRALVMDFAGDRVCMDIRDQYMYGPALMVAPVYVYGARERKVHLPAGTGWYDLNAGTLLDGGQDLVCSAPYERIPLFAPQGSILLLGPELQYASEKPADPIHILVFTGKDARFTLYEDEGINYNYEHGAYATIPVIYNENEGLLKIGPREGEFPGMLRERTFLVSFIGPDSKFILGSDLPDFTTVEYTGVELSLKR